MDIHGNIHTHTHTQFYYLERALFKVVKSFCSRQSITLGTCINTFKFLSICIKRSYTALERILFIISSLIDIPCPCFLPSSSTDRDTCAVTDQYAHSQHPFISQRRSRHACMRPFWIFIFKCPHVSKLNWAS